MEQNISHGYKDYAFNDCAIDTSYIVIKSEQDADTAAVLMDDEAASTSKQQKLMTEEQQINSPGTLYWDDNEGTTYDTNGNSILFQRYFKIIKMLNNTEFQRRRSGVQVECCICKAQLQGSKQISSNFVRHLRIKHENAFLEYEALKSAKPKTLGCEQQEKFRKSILRFIASNMLPISIVDNSSFKELMWCANPKLKLMTQTSIAKVINELHMNMLDEQRSDILGCKYVCTAADIWLTKYNSTLLSYTCHWLDEGLLSARKSLALGFRYFHGTRNFNKIRHAILDIHAQYGLSVNNVTAIITENGTNLLNAFKDFGVEESTIRNELDEDEEELLNVNTDDDESQEAEIELEKFPDHFFDNSLPKEIKCATHELCLIVTKDFIEILKREPIKYEKHKEIMKKCSNYWSKVKQQNISEMFPGFLGTTQLKYPTITNWNSLYEAIKDLINHKQYLSTLCQKLEIMKFDESDFEYLFECLQLLNPITESIHFLQNQNGVVYGYLLPTLATIRTKYRKFQLNERFVYFNGFAEQLEQALTNRFSHYFNLKSQVNDAIVAAVLCPEIKLKWIKSLNPSFPSTKINEINDLVKKTIARELSGNFIIVESKRPDDLSGNGFFDFSLPDESFEDPNIPVSPIENEFLAYMMDTATSATMLNRYPTIKQAYMKYNTPLPSSVAMEKLFPFAEIINVSRRVSCSDSYFEKLMILKANERF